MSICELHFLNYRYGVLNKDTWAVVTGSAMGIGKAYSFELAKMGFNLLLIDKDESQMEKTKEELNSLGVKVDNEQIISKLNHCFTQYAQKFFI